LGGKKPKPLGEKSMNNNFKRKQKLLIILSTVALVGGVSSYLIYSSFKHKKIQPIAVRAAQPITKKTPALRVKYTYPDKLVGEKVTLKKLAMKDAFDYHKAFSADVRKWLEFPEKVSFGYVASFVGKRIKYMHKNMLISYTIWDNKDEKLVGAIKIIEKNHPDFVDFGQLAMWINENYRGGGRVQEAIFLISKEYFKKYPRRKSYNAHTREWNKASSRALEKFGFKKVGKHTKDGKLFAIVYELDRKLIEEKEKPLNEIKK
jgi:RimJ/RimL family protein N-acetyltransferase